jgi:hypothetical protein
MMTPKPDSHDRKYTPHEHGESSKKGKYEITTPTIHVIKQRGGEHKNQ